MFYFWMPYDWVLVFPLLLSLYASYKVRSTFSKYSQVASTSGRSARDIARSILRADGITDVPVEPVPGNLTDHYSPMEKVLRLSEPVYYSNSIAAIGVAAHEAGHAIQHHRAYAPLALRNMVAPVAGFGSYLGPVLFMVGLFLGGMRSVVGMYAAYAGLVIFTGAAFFTVVTLPVEIDASRRAIGILREEGYLGADEIPMARKVLTAAALTYVAAMLMAVIRLAQFALILSGTRRSD